MEKIAKACFKNLRYLRLVGVIASVLITVIGSNGDGGGTDKTPTISDTDPSLIKLPDGRYRMYFQLVPSSGLGIASAVSQVME